MSSDNKISVETYEIKKNKKKIKKKFDFTQGDTWRHTATQLQANGLRCN